MKKLYPSLFIALAFTTFSQTYWKVDAGHGYCGFSLKYMLIGDYKGSFKSFGGKVVTKTETDFTDATFNIVFDINSVSAEEEGHEGMLKGSDFFDAARYPLAYFRSTSVKNTGKGTYSIDGDLTIRNVTKKITFTGIAAGKPVTNPYFGTTNYGIAISGNLKRSDFGVGFFHLMNDGELVLSDDVNLTCTLILLKAANAFVPMSSKINAEEKLLNTYAGLYDTGKWGAMIVSSEEGKLFTKMPDEPRKELLPMANNKFFYEFTDATIEFVSENGKISKLVQTNGANKIEAQKISDAPQNALLAPVQATAEPNYGADAWEALLVNNYARAIELCNNALAKGPNGKVQTRLAHAYLFSGDHAKALEMYKEGIANEKTKGSYAKRIQEDFTFFRARKFPVEAMNKAFKDLAIEPNAAYKGMK